MPRAATDETANAAVEFALVAPVLVVMLLGILFYGLYFGAAHAVQQIAADGARAAIAGLTGAERDTLVRSTIEREVAQTGLLAPAAVSVDVAQTAGSVRVAVRYDASALPIWAFSGLVPVPSRVIERVSVIDVGS